MPMVLDRKKLKAQVFSRELSLKNVVKSNYLCGFTCFKKKITKCIYENTSYKYIVMLKKCLKYSALHFIRLKRHSLNHVKSSKSFVVTTVFKTQVFIPEPLIFFFICVHMVTLTTPNT